MQNILTKEVKIGEEIFDRFRFLPRLLSGSTLKLLAVITMAVDHFAASILYYMLLEHRFPFGMDFYSLYELYGHMRIIGRQAFPIYCFLLVEGLLHTRSRPRYLCTMLLFSLLSELPFDLAVVIEVMPDSLDIPAVLEANRPVLFSHQNVFFTLSVGLAVICGIDALRKRYGTCLLTLLGAIPISTAAFFLAERSNMDYGGTGILLILLFYLFHPIPVAAAGTGYLILSRLELENFAFPAFLAMLFYNGERGFLGRRTGVKLFFYAFYPLHFTLYVILRALWMQHM